jgi:hypothetical protein
MLGHPRSEDLLKEKGKDSLRLLVSKNPPHRKGSVTLPLGSLQPLFLTNLNNLGVPCIHGSLNLLSFRL